MRFARLFTPISPNGILMFVAKPSMAKTPSKKLGHSSPIWFSWNVAMPRTNGIAVASVLKDTMPNVRIVLFTMYSEAVDRALAVDAIVAKADGMNRLEECVQSLLRS
jgi:DNA-binding NarL/FixJ family response regulator